MNHLIPATFALSLASLAAVATGCGQYQTLDLPSEPAHMRYDYEEKQGLAVAAQVLVDPLAIEYHFGPELSQGGYFPVLIQLENRGQTAFEIQRKHFRVILENGEKFEPVPPMQVFTTIRRGHLRTALLAPLIVPAIISYRNTEDYNFLLARALRNSALPDALRLEEQDPPLSRVLFFHDPRKRPASEFDSSVLEFLAEEEGSRLSGAAAKESAGGETQKSPPQPQSRETGPRSRTIGKVISFTVSLVREDGP